MAAFTEALKEYTRVACAPKGRLRLQILRVSADALGAFVDSGERDYERFYEQAVTTYTDELQGALPARGGRLDLGPSRFLVNLGSYLAAFDPRQAVDRFRSSIIPSRDPPTHRGAQGSHPLQPVPRDCAMTQNSISAAPFRP